MVIRKLFNIMKLVAVEGEQLIVSVQRFIYLDRYLQSIPY